MITMSLPCLKVRVQGKLGILVESRYYEVHEYMYNNTKIDWYKQDNPSVSVTMYV